MERKLLHLKKFKRHELKRYDNDIQGFASALMISGTAGTFVNSIMLVPDNKLKKTTA
jgi:hypothetical protein